MNLLIEQKQTHGHRKQTYCQQRGKGGGGINQEFGKTDKQQGPTEQHRQLHSISYNNLQWNLKRKMIVENLSRKPKQSHRLRKQIYDYQKGKVEERDKLGG